MTTPEDRIKAALEAHERVTGRRDLRQHCSCKWASEERREISAHRAHLASVLAALFPAAETVREWVPVACEVADVIRHSEHVKPTSSKTDLTGEYGEPEVYTEWSAIYPSGRELPILREHRWPGSHGEPDPKPCEHLVRTRYAEHVGPWEVAE